MNIYKSIDWLDLNSKAAPYTEDNGKVITFKEGSKFALWAAAQGALTDKAAVERLDSDLAMMYVLHPRRVAEIDEDSVWSEIN